MAKLQKSSGKFSRQYISLVYTECLGDFSRCQQYCIEMGMAVRTGCSLSVTICLPHGKTAQRVAVNS